MSTLAVQKRRSPTRGKARVIFKDVPPGYQWGWFSREDPRMHVQPVDKKHFDEPYKVWLERDGRRVLEAEPGMPTKVWKPLRAFITQRRAMIEAHWIEFMVDNHWLEFHVANPVITLVAYPNYPHRFIRLLNLHDHIGNPQTVAAIGPQEVAFNKELACLEIFPKRIEQRRHHMRLEPVLWT